MPLRPQFIVISAFGAVLSAAAAAALHHLPGDTARSLACGGPRLGAGLQVHTHHLVDGQGNGHGHQPNPIHGLEVLALLEAIAQVLAPVASLLLCRVRLYLGLLLVPHPYPPAVLATRLRCCGFLGMVVLPAEAVAAVIRLGAAATSFSEASN